MEDYLSLALLNQHEQALTGKIFTKNHLAILRKKLEGKTLTSNERTYYYKAIKPKITAMKALLGIQDLTVNGEERIIKQRLEQAKSILRKLERKHKRKGIIISGSFLFSKEYKDIDAFIITDYKKQDYTKGKLHVTYLPKNATSTPLFQSIAKMCVSNFPPTITPTPKTDLASVLQSYELLINARLGGEDDDQELRNFILQTTSLAYGVILDPQQLSEAKKKLYRRNNDFLSGIIINALTLSYDEHTAAALKSRLEDYRDLGSSYANAENIKIYIGTYAKVIALASDRSQENPQGSPP